MLDFYIFSNIHVGLAVFCLTKITLIHNGIDTNLLPFFTFFSTVASYNLIRLYKLPETQGWVFKFIERNKRLVFGITFLSTILVFYLGFKLKINTLLVLIPFGLFTFFYVIPIPVQKNNSIALRSVAFLKLFLIALSWAGVTVLVPAINYDILVNSDLLITFLQRFLFVIVITLPFDIRDVYFDDTSLKTLPQVIGVQQSKKIGLFFLMLFLGLELLKNPMVVEELRIDLIIALLSLFLLFKATASQGKYYSTFFVESMPIVWLLLLIGH